MEIRIRTHEELRTDRVTIEITGTGAEVTEFAETRLPSRNLYTDEEVANLQASEVELVAGPLRRRIAELEAELSRRASVIKKLENKVEGYDTDRHTERDRADQVTREHEACAGKLELREKDADTWRRQRNELEAQVKDLEEGRAADHREIVTLRGRAAELESKLLKGHVCTGGCSGDQHVAFVGRKALIEAENQVAELTRRIDNARVILSDARVVEARNKSVTTLETVLGGAIEKALNTLTWH